MEGQLNNFNKDYKLVENFQPQNTKQFSMLKNIAWLMTIINVIALFINAVLAFLYMQGLGGFAAIIILPVIGVVYFVGVTIFLKWASSMNNRGRYDFARNIVIGIIIISGLLFVLNGSGLKENFKERQRGQSYNIVNQGNLSYQDCLDLAYPRAMSMCGQNLVDNNNLLGCLKLSKETYLLYPETFKSPGFSCSFKTKDTSRHVYNATLLDDEEELTKILRIFDKRKTDYYKIKDQQKYDSAKNYNDCLQIENVKKAEECSKKIFSQNKNMIACVKFSHDFRKKKIEFNLQRDAHDYYIGCAYKGLVYTGRLYDQGIDFNKKIEVYDELLAQDLYINEDVAKVESIYKYCSVQTTQKIGLNDELLDNIKNDVKKYLDIDFVYRPCANNQDYLVAKQRLEAISYLLETNYLPENDIYMSTGFAANKAQDYQCPRSFHQLQITDTMPQEIKDALLMFGVDKLYRPCTSEEEYEYFQSLLGADWGFEDENIIIMTSSKQVINIDKFKSTGLAYSNIYSINSGGDKKVGNYLYQVAIVFEDAVNIEVRQYTMDDKLKLSIVQRYSNGSIGPADYCNIENYKDDILIEIKEFEPKIGSLFSIDFNAKADCRGEIFDISGHIKTRVSANYLKE